MWLTGERVYAILPNQRAQPITQFLAMDDCDIIRIQTCDHWMIGRALFCFLESPSLAVLSTESKHTRGVHIKSLVKFFVHQNTRKAHKIA